MTYDEIIKLLKKDGHNPTRHKGHNGHRCNYGPEGRLRLIAKDDCAYWDGKYYTHSELVKLLWSEVETDIVNKPPHYLFTNPATDVLDVMKECGFNMQDHFVASAIAYLCRCKKKGQYDKDLKKAQFYINKAVQHAEASKSNNQ